MSTLTYQENYPNSSPPDADHWVRAIGHIGLAAKAITYLLLGFLTFKYAFSAGGKLTDTKGALSEIGGAPYGQVLLAIVGVALIAFALFRIVLSWKDVDNKGSDFKGMIDRVFFAFRGLIYGAMGASILGLTFGGSSGSGSGSSTKESMVAELMAAPWGPWLVGIAGISVIVFGLSTGWTGYKQDFMKKMRQERMSESAIKAARRMGAAGLISRAVVICITGYFLIQAALTHDADKTGGIKEALAWIGSQPYGPYLLGIVGAGLFIYGLYAVVLARYRKFLKRQ